MSGYSGYHKRAPPPLPDPATLPFPANLVRGCTDCGLRTGCTAPVPGIKIEPTEIMLVGQNPGQSEDLWGLPFYGAAGQYLNSLLFNAGIPRENVAISNLVKCLSPNNRAPSAAELAACAKWINLEVELVNPRILVAMGAPAIHHFLGSGAGSVEHLHGRPIEKDGRIILPAYHPAAALHDTDKLRQCSEDFQVLRGLAKGTPPEEYCAHDEYPNPVYDVLDTPEKISRAMAEIEQVGEFAVDTEQCRGRSWSVQLSCHPGTAYFIPLKDDFKGRFDLSFLKAKGIVHYYLHDIGYVNLRDDQFTDTMVLAYLLNLPQGLKELASRLCGVNMVNYNEMVRPQQWELSIGYLTKVDSMEWPNPPPIFETKWNNKKGELVTREKKPWSISRKIDAILKDIKNNTDADPYQRWKDIPVIERSVVESKMGPMPEASLMDIKFEDAVQYASRDADVSLRVKRKMQKMIEDLDLDLVLDTDIRILPMVYNMMHNGMAIDVPHYQHLSEDYDIRLRVKAAELAGMVGHSFNPASSQQVATVIYGELGFPVTAKTPTGEISTDDAELKKTKHPVAINIIRYRGIQKLKSTYADNMIRSARLDENGIYRMHTKLNTTRVATGRLSSSKDDEGNGTNLQNIPTRNKEAKAIKNGFIAPEGWILLEGDYSQVEMTTLAHLSNCARLIELFNRGGDPHTEMAARIFGLPMPKYEKGVPDEAAQSKYRYPVKRLNFGIAYLIGAHGLANQIQEYISDLEMEGEKVDIEPWDEPTCEKFIADWYKLNPEVKDFQMAMAAMARRYGYVKDIFGRMRYIPEATCPIKSVQEAGLRQAANQPVTASAQEIIKAAMGQLWEQLPHTEWADKARWLIQIHDSLIVELQDDDTVISEFIPWMRNIMCGVVSLRVPVKVDFKTGMKWGELKKYELASK